MSQETEKRGDNKDFRIIPSEDYLSIVAAIITQGYAFVKLSKNQKTQSQRPANTKVARITPLGQEYDHSNLFYYDPNKLAVIIINIRLDTLGELGINSGVRQAHKERYTHMGASETLSVFAKRKEIPQT